MRRQKALTSAELSGGSPRTGMYRRVVCYLAVVPEELGHCIDDMRVVVTSSQGVYGLGFALWAGCHGYALSPQGASVRTLLKRFRLHRKRY